MRIPLTLIALLVAANAYTQRAVTPPNAVSNALPTAITVDGSTYQDVRWGRVTPSTVTIFHKTGVATIPLEKLPPEIQKQFNYDPQRAKDWDTQAKAAEEADRKAKLAKQEAKQKAEQLKEYAHTSLRGPAKVGAIGILEYGAQVSQVLNDHEMLASVQMNFWIPESGATARSIDGTMQKESVVLVPTGGYLRPYPVDVLIRGLPTTGIADNTGINPNGIFQVTGTWTYNTAMGSTKTVYVLEPFKQ